MFCTRAARAALPFVTVFASLAFAFQSSPAVNLTPRPDAARGVSADRSPGAVPEAYLRLDASMVLVPVQVTTQSGAPLLDLGEDRFRVYEDGIEQTIRYFVEDDAPVSVGLLFDSSASMRDKRRQAAEAVAALFKTANAEDEFFLITFDEKPRLEVPFTTDTDALYQEASHMRPFGRTSLFDAIHMALDAMKQARHQRRALVILSDGGDNRSRSSFSSIKNDVIESEVPIYAMGIFDPEGEKPDSPEEAHGPDLLSRLAELTGGRHFPVRLAELPEISTTIGKLLRTQYLLGYFPTNQARDGTYRSITLEVSAPVKDPVRIWHRKGYRAPSR